MKLLFFATRWNCLYPVSRKASLPYLAIAAALVCFELSLGSAPAATNSKLVSLAASSSLGNRNSASIEQNPTSSPRIVSDSSAHDKEMREILVLGAYDHQNPRSQARVAEFAVALSDHLGGAKVHAELVEADPRSSRADQFRRTLDSLFVRYRIGSKNPHLDAIVVLDNESLDFSLTSGWKLFKDIPTVFVGIGEPDPRVYQRRAIYTGEFYTPDVDANVELAFTQFPDARKMVIVLDNTEEGEYLARQFEQIKHDSTDRRFVFFNSKNIDTPKLLELLKTLSQGTVVFWGSWKQDKSGPVPAWKAVERQASDICSVPMYGFDGSQLGSGILGGKLLVSENPSQRVAKILQQIFEGASPGDIPIQNGSRFTYAFDYPQLARWKISLSEIPPGSYVANRPGIDFVNGQFTFWSASGLLFVIAVFCALIISVRYRRRAESQRRNIEQRFSFIYEESPLAYQSLDAKGRILSVNRAWCELLEMNAKDGIGRKFFDFLAPDSKRIFLEYWEQCTRTDYGETRIDLPSIEIRLVSYHGHIIPVLFYLRKVYDPAEKTTAFYSAMHDISQRRDAEDTLRQEDIRLNSLLTLNQMLDSSIANITEYALRASLELTESERGYLAFVNDNEESLTLYAWAFEHDGEYSVLNEPLTFPANTAGLWDGILEERRPVLVNDTHAPNPYWHRFSDDSYLPGRRLSVPVFDKDRIVAIASVANKQREYTEHDIQQLTLLLEGMWRIVERKKTTDKLHEYTNNLENANRQLEECSLAAQQASRAKSEFLANMSHEIRTPMTAIIGFTELLRTEGDISKAPTARIEAIDTVNRNANYLLFLLNDILDLSKIEAGHLEIEYGDCDTSRLISDVSKLMETRAITKGLQLIVDTGDDVPETIRTDSYRLRQILLNLLGNAVKFTEQGMVRLVVSRKKQKNGEDRIFFEVIDTGIGIAQDHIGQIFDPFTQADSSTSRKFGGTGLGLCISRKLARMLGGELYVESELGVGSIFTLSLPCVLAIKDHSSNEPFECSVHVKCGTAETADKTTSKSKQEINENLNCHILVADDGVDNRRLISAFLNKAGARVTLCENGRMAYERIMAERQEGSKASKNPVDLVLMDMQMPVMDGYQATQKLREAGYQGTIIAITANAMKKDRDKCLEAGCDDYLTKPINRNALIQTVTVYTQQKKQAAQTLEAAREAELLTND